MRNILFISPTGTLDNGAEISIFNLMKYLVKEGNNVFNIAPQSYRPDQGLYYDEGMRNKIDTHFISVVKWWWEEAPGVKSGSYSDRLVGYRNNIKDIREYIKKNKIDLVITNTVNIYTGALAAACESVPHYWLIHEFPKDEFSYYIDKKDFIDEYSDQLYCVKGELHKELSQLFPNREVKTFSPYTDIKTVKLKDATLHRLVSVGRITKRKNQLELIKAYKNLGDPNIPLVFIGAWDKDYKNICDTYIKNNKLHNITFVGNMDNPWSEVSNKDVCIFTSAMETYGLVYVESLLNGVPSILSNNPGHLSAYELFNFGEIYKLGNIDDLTRKIRSLLLNFDSMKKKAEKFSYEASKKYQITNVYSEILEDILIDSRESKKSIRHIADLLSENEHKSKLARLESKTRRLLLMIKHKLAR